MQEINNCMKSIFLSACILILSISINVNAQNLTLSHSGNDVSNNTLDINGTPSQEIKAIFNITNTSNSDINIKVKKRVNEDIDGTDNTFCLTSCFSPDVYESPDHYTVGAGQTTSSEVFYVQFYPNGMSGNAQISYEVFNVDNVDDKVTVTVNFNITPSSIYTDGMNASIRAFPNPAIGPKVNFNFSLPLGMLNPRLTVYNLLGVKVIEKELDTNIQEFELDISKLSKGIYLYSLDADNKRIITKKLIVR